MAFPITDDIHQTLSSFLVAAALLHGPAGTLLVDRHQRDRIQRFVEIKCSCQVHFVKMSNYVCRFFCN